jgi:hypothetical protein
MMLRFLRYPEERARFFRERILKKHQDERLSHGFQKQTESLIVFFVPGADRKTGNENVSGGIISLVSLCEETMKLENAHNAKTLMCTFPREYLLAKHINFENNVNLYRFEQVVGYFQNLKKIIIHLPDDSAVLFLPRLFKKETKWLRNIIEVHINIVNANILLMPSPEQIKNIESFATKTTMTAAHAKYCSLYFRKFYGLPLHKFSTWVSPEQYNFKEYICKKNTIVVSPDVNPEREKIMSLLRNCEGLEIIVLQGLTHTEYKETVSHAKWALTFGEGLDGYFVEPVFSGSIAFAVYNEDFFTEDFKDLPGIFPSYENLAENIIEDMHRYDNPQIFTDYQKKQFDLCAKYYSYKEYQDNIRQFYLGNYTFK